jgi:O-antigen/teichoic acid export membrane protein
LSLLSLNPTKALQLFQLVRYASLLLIGVLFAQFGLSTYDIGIYESLIFLASLLSFFWLSGVTQGVLSIYREGENDRTVIGSAFFSLIIMSLISGLAFKVLLTPYSIMANNPEVLYFGAPIFWFMLLSGPAFMAEYILLIKKKSKMLAVYALVSYPIQLGLVVVPVILGNGLEQALNGLVYAAGFRFIIALALVLKHGSLSIQINTIKELLSVSWPLILGTLLSGSAEYIDGMIVSRYFDEATFAIYRYGAKEFPLFILMAAAFSNAKINEVARSQDLNATAIQLRKGASDMMKWFFPIAIMLTVLSPWLFEHFFNSDFTQSAFVFNAYLLTLASRMMFPQTLLIGRGFTRTVMNVGMMEIGLNLALSLILVTQFGILGIAYASVIAFVFEKVALSIQVKRRLNISPSQIIPAKSLLLWSLVLLAAHLGIYFLQ